MVFEIIGLIGAFAFAISALPQAWKSYDEGHSRGVSAGLLWLWLIGEVFTLIYTLPLWKIPLLLNYGGNLVLLLIIMYYKYYEREEETLMGDLDK